jgi:hypothetical protein
MRESKLRQMRTTPSEESRIATYEKPFLGEIDAAYGNGLDCLFMSKLEFLYFDP